MCPFAAWPPDALQLHWLAMVMACWSARVVHAGPGAVARFYLDDLVVFGRNWDATAVAGAWETTNQFGGAFGLVLNADKTYIGTFRYTLWIAEFRKTCQTKVLRLCSVDMLQIVRKRSSVSWV